MAVRTVYRKDRSMAEKMAGPTDRTMAVRTAERTAVRTVDRKDRSMAVKMAVSMADH
jgi:hypothetical protein